ncbi:hypothetical protein [Bacillus sp. CMF12]|nr:hypothetical protein [Bacillus sp. CMF12]
MRAPLARGVPLFSTEQSDTLPCYQFSYTMDIEAEKEQRLTKRLI